MSVVNKSVFERETDKQAPNEGQTADCHLPRIAKAMQKYHLQTETHRYKRANSGPKLSQFCVLVRGCNASYFGLNLVWLTGRQWGQVNSPPQWLSGQQAQWQVKALTCYCRTYSAEAADMQKLATVFSSRIITITTAAYLCRSNSHSGWQLSVKWRKNVDRISRSRWPRLELPITVFS